MEYRDFFVHLHLVIITSKQKNMTRHHSYSNYSPRVVAKEGNDKILEKDFTPEMEKAIDQLDEQIADVKIMTDGYSPLLTDCLLPDIINIYHDKPANIAAQRQREYWGLGDQPIVSVGKELSRHGFIIGSFSLPEASDLLGLSVMVDDFLPAIIVNKPLHSTIERYRFTLLYCAAQAMLNIAIEECINDDEKPLHRLYYHWYSLWAGDMLLPPKVVAPLVKRYNAKNFRQLLADMHSEWGVSVASILHNMRDHGLSSQDFHTLYDKYIRDDIKEEQWQKYDKEQIPDKPILPKQWTKETAK